MPKPEKPGPAAKADRAAPFEIGGISVAPGSRATVDLPLSLLFDHTPMSLTIRVVHGRLPGPTLLVCAAVHGDEINGVEIIRRVLRLRGLGRMRGTLIAAPIVNTYGFINQSRYLPDRRDLNRSFPGSASGSLTSQLAHLFSSQVVSKCTHGIDLHTGAIHRANFPQIRGDLSDPETRRLAIEFGVPVLLNAKVREGSLRGFAADHGIPLLVYEGGEALRFDRLAIRTGYRGVIRVMRALDMLPRTDEDGPAVTPIIAKSNSWVRAPVGGILRDPARLGSRVEPGSELGVIGDPLGTDEIHVLSEASGIIVGRTNLPVVNQGDGLFNIARVADPASAQEAVQIFHEDWEFEPGAPGRAPISVAVT